MKTYTAYRINGDPVVTVTDDYGQRELLPGPSRRIWDHSPTGFEWGYGGSGPAQLALAILFDATGRRGLASCRYQTLKWEFIANAPKAGFTLTQREIEQWLDTKSPGWRRCDEEEE